MFRSIYTLLFCICALPVTGQCTDDPQASFLIAKEKLQCLYKQSESLLNEPGDPIMIVLNSQCAQAPAQLNIGERGTLPVLNPKVGPDATLKPEDVLMLTHAQLQCFKQGFARLMQQTNNPVQVRFTDNCSTEDGDKP